jgi:hypothetical protein
LQNKRHATDDFESLPGRIAITFRRNMNKKTDSEYLNATCECFARALEQYFAIETYGPEASLIYSSGKTLAQFRGYFSEESYVSKKVYEEEMKPMIAEYLKSIDVEKVIADKEINCQMKTKYPPRIQQFKFRTLQRKSQNCK